MVFWKKRLKNWKAEKTFDFHFHQQLNLLFWLFCRFCIATRWWPTFRLSKAASKQSVKRITITFYLFISLAQRSYDASNKSWRSHILSREKSLRPDWDSHCNAFEHIKYFPFIPAIIMSEQELTSRMMDILVLKGRHSHAHALVNP